MERNLFSLEAAIQYGQSMQVLGYIMTKYNMNNFETIYHYTDVNGFISIIQNREFWLSHMRFMNDRKEYLEGKELLKKIIDDLLLNDDGTFDDLLRKVLKILDEEVLEGNWGRSSEDVFSLSLSHSRDSLDMWRGYGRNSGIAIGLDIHACMELPGMCMVRKEQYEDDLKQCGNKPEKMWPHNERLLLARNVLYDDEKKEEILLEILNITLEHYKYLKTKKVGWAEESALDCITKTLFDIFPYLKNKGFKNENECRFVENLVYSKGEVPLKVYYRERNGLVLPYIKYVLLDLNCRPLKKWPIKEIVIGPGLKQNDVVESVRFFLKHQGLNDLVEKVVTSDIPYVAV